MQSVLQLTEAHYQSLLHNASECFPNEACGLLAGEILARSGHPTIKRVLEVILIPNADPSPTWFRLNPELQRKAHWDMYRKGLQLAGIFHSHPASPAFPSRTDVAQAHWPGTDELLYPDASWVIVSLQNPQKPLLRSFLITGHRHPLDIQEESIQELPSQSR